MSHAPSLLVDGASGALVEAQIRCGLGPKDLRAVERAWQPHRDRLRHQLTQARIPRREWPQSLEWDWGRKVRELDLLVAAACGLVALGEWQAMMITKTAPQVAWLADDRGRPLVYVDFLEVAPWNWPIPGIGQGARFRGSGSVLLRQAVAQSLREEFQGRVGLHALPQAAAFYARCGMTRVGGDAEVGGLSYFEFGRAAARRFFRGQMP